MAELGRSFIMGAEETTEEEVKGKNIGSTKDKRCPLVASSDLLLVRMATFCRAELFLTMANFCCCRRNGQEVRQRVREEVQTDRQDRKSPGWSHLLLHLGAASQAVPAAVVYGHIAG